MEDYINSDSTMKGMFSILKSLAIAFLITYFLVTFVAQFTIVNGSSMNATYKDNDIILVEKVSMHVSEPERFDVIVFEQRKDLYYIKRVIGLPGETVQIGFDGKILINGNILDENFGLEAILDPGIAIEPITLGNGEYFVLGDNRNNSSDSRDPSVGIIKKEDIIGKSLIRVF